MEEEDEEDATGQPLVASRAPVGNCRPLHPVRRVTWGRAQMFCGSGEPEGGPTVLSILILSSEIHLRLPRSPRSNLAFIGGFFIDTSLIAPYCNTRLTFVSACFMFRPSQCTASLPVTPWPRSPVTRGRTCHHVSRLWFFLELLVCQEDGCASTFPLCRISFPRPPYVFVIEGSKVTARDLWVWIFVAYFP